MNSLNFIILGLALFLLGCNTTSKNTEEKKPKKTAPFYWESANLYFLLVDRFNNGDTSNDINYERNKETAILRGFDGGDIKGITQKINEGYFTNLGINAIWMTPIVEQVHGLVDEGTGATYGYHGYWTKDWTALDPNFGTKEDLKILVETAHKKGIRIVLDAVINHTGPVTKKDAAWPKDWIMQNPVCEHTNYETSTSCTLVKNLPDIITSSNENVDLPPFLIEKWKKEGRYEKEIQELDAFFARTGHPRAPRFYIMKWLTDYITDFGIDGYRCDTVKHTEAYVWKEFKEECNYAFAEWKKNNAEKVLDNTPFYMVGEVYNYFASPERSFDYGDKKVDFYNYGFNSLINFDIRGSQKVSYEGLFSKYSNLLQTSYKDLGILNYVTSHDDGYPFDKTREKPFEAANRLLLTNGTAQVYYGDEVARNLLIEGTIGDATLRSNMDWKTTHTPKTKEILSHWQKLGIFRKNHPAVGAGIHQKISDNPYVFSRVFNDDSYEDKVVIALDLPLGKKNISVKNIFKNGTQLIDVYSGKETLVENQKITIDTSFDIVLLEQK